VTNDRPLGLFEAIYTTRAIRRFRPDAVPDDVLFQVLDAAIRAPTGQNAQDWRFLIITDQGAKERLQAHAEEAWARYQPRFAERPDLMDGLPRTQRLSLRAVEYLTHHLAETPVIIAVCGLRGRHSSPGGSTFPAIQNLLLAARALGLGGSIFNLPLAGAQDVLADLGVPEEHQVYCLVPLGYPADRLGPVRRKPVRGVTFWNRWDSPWTFAEKQPDEGWQARWVEGG
jgi:nitroreductase